MCSKASLLLIHTTVTCILCAQHFRKKLNFTTERSSLTRVLMRCPRYVLLRCATLKFLDHARQSTLFALHPVLACMQHHSAARYHSFCRLTCAARTFKRHAPSNFMCSLRIHISAPAGGRLGVRLWLWGVFCCSGARACLDRCEVRWTQV